MSRTNPLSNAKMNQEFFANLPSEIIINILSRLPVRTIIICKCVCKSWLDLLETHEFVKSHLSRSVPGLIVRRDMQQINSYRIFEFVDVLDLEHHELHYNPVTNFDFPHQYASIRGSANGLLLLHDSVSEPDAYYVCNPITRDYIKLNCPQEFAYSDSQVATYGFGTSRVTVQHKVVKIFHNCILNQERRKWQKFPEAECQVYTLGTGSWRRLRPGVSLEYGCSTNDGAFVNGNLHWLVYDLKGSPWISCFDLETELFSTFSPPLQGRRAEVVADVFALNDCLCLCDNSPNNEIVIWLMKEYGVEKSWTKEFVVSKISHPPGDPYEVVRAIKVFKDGDILMSWEDYWVFYYSNKTKTIQSVDLLQLYDPILYTPSFLSLKSFRMENISSF